MTKSKGSTPTGKRVITASNKGLPPVKKTPAMPKVKPPKGSKKG